MPNLTELDHKKMSINQSFKAYERADLKVMYRIKLNNERHIITKILKLDENNQYGFAMTKPMPAGCIKEHPAPSWLKFNFVLKTANLDNKIGHLFAVDIEFDEKRATEQEYRYNEVLPAALEKQEILGENERSVYQLLDLFCKASDNKPKLDCCTAKSHATL